MVDPSVILQAINGVGSSTERVIKRQRQRRGNRMKVYDNGYIFTYDKDSQCGQRSFWRCERKSECQARVHTNPVTNQIIKRINEHTHEPPNREDLPPWLVLNQTPNADGSEEGTSKESTTGVLINTNYSTNSQLAKIIERELDGNESDEMTSAADVSRISIQRNSNNSALLHSEGRASRGANDICLFTSEEKEKIGQKRRNTC